MSSLDNLIAKLRSDGDEKIQLVIKEAEKEAAQIINEGITQGNKEKDGIISAAEAEATRLKEQIVMQKRIAVRDAKLHARQEIFEKVLAAAALKLKDMPKVQYKSFLTDYLTAMQLDGGGELVLPEKYQDLNVKELGNDSLIAGLSVYHGDRKIESGFAVLKGGMEYNNSFEALIEYYRDELEKIITDTLF